MVKNLQPSYNFCYPSSYWLFDNVVISSSIALSLGMVGALSIVRFRTPVKNPIELVMYFLLITMGIVTNVDPNLTLNFISDYIVFTILRIQKSCFKVQFFRLLF